MNLDLEVQNNDEQFPAEPAVESQVERVWNRIRNYGFSVGGWNFLLKQGLYSELLITPEIAPLPGSPPHFLGLTNVRGNLVPVYQLELWLNEPGAAPTTSPRYALIIDAVEKGVALVVGDKPLSVSLGDFHEEARGEDISSTFGGAVAASYRQSRQALGATDRETWHLLNHQHLFHVLSTSEQAD